MLCDGCMRKYVKGLREIKLMGLNWPFVTRSVDLLI
jgi:hypothetical protein